MFSILDTPVPLLASSPAKEQEDFPRAETPGMTHNVMCLRDDALGRDAPFLAGVV